MLGTEEGEEFSENRIQTQSVKQAAGSGKPVPRIPVVSTSDQVEQ